MTTEELCSLLRTELDYNHELADPDRDSAVLETVLQCLLDKWDLIEHTRSEIDSVQQAVLDAMNAGNGVVKLTNQQYELIKPLAFSKVKKRGNGCNTPGCANTLVNPDDNWCPKCVLQTGAKS